VSRLLILSCSQRKNPDPSPLAAITRYDGPFFRALRRGRDATADVETYVLSARFGLIHAADEIPWYDQRLTATGKRELAGKIGPRLKGLADPSRFSAAFVCAGRDYLDVLDPHLDDLRAALPVTLAAGGLGEKLTRLAGWLIGPRPLGKTRERADGRTIRVRGVEITATRNDILALADEALRAGDPSARKCHGWYVPVEGGRIAPKWLIHKLTSLPVGRFHSDDARRALAALDVPVLPCE
jgi:hypothetical protein